MAALANLIGFGPDRPAPLVAMLSARIGTVVRRSACARYVEQSEKITRTGLAGMI